MVKNVDKRGRRFTRFTRLINLCPRFSVARGYRRCCLPFLVTVCWCTDIFAPTDIQCNGPGTQGRRLSRFQRESTARRIISVLRCGFNLEILDDTSCIWFLQRRRKSVSTYGLSFHFSYVHFIKKQTKFIFLTPRTKVRRKILFIYNVDTSSWSYFWDLTRLSCYIINILAF